MCFAQQSSQMMSSRWPRISSQSLRSNRLAMTLSWPPRPLQSLWPTRLPSARRLSLPPWTARSSRLLFLNYLFILEEILAGIQLYIRISFEGARKCYILITHESRSSFPKFTSVWGFMAAVPLLHWSFITAAAAASVWPKFSRLCSGQLLFWISDLSMN